MSQAPDKNLLSLRMYLIIKAMESGCGYFMAAEAVSSTMMEWSNPDAALRTYSEWEQIYNKEK